MPNENFNPLEAYKYHMTEVVRARFLDDEDKADFHLAEMDYYWYRLSPEQHKLREKFREETIACNLRPGGMPTHLLDPYIPAQGIPDVQPETTRSR